MKKLTALAEILNTELNEEITGLSLSYKEITIECTVSKLKSVLYQLRDNANFLFDQLIDLCGVDYSLYGIYDWETESATETGFSRGIEMRELQAYRFQKPRFAVVYHLLSTTKNQRIRVRVSLEDSHLIVPSVHEIWKAANWFEREAYDLFGILFDGHPDLRRILTDYGFIGHPFRKDFPISGHVEMRYDALSQKVIYDRVDIDPRMLSPKVIRKDNRYLDGSPEGKNRD